MTLEQVSKNKSFGGDQLRYKHFSKVLNCEMNFSIYLPPQSIIEAKPPILYWLSGLTCTDENFVTKAGAQQYAAKYGVAIVCPDTSPRGEDVADDPDGAWDFGLGAGFYLNATQQPYAKHYQMYDYIVDELPRLIANNFPVDSSKTAISGHSMGGHGALTIGLKNPEKYCSISAFSPICAPMQAPWGKKALSNYLGDDESQWLQYDSLQLLQNLDSHAPILIEQGSDDNFLNEQLKPELIESLKEYKGLNIQIDFQEGYDHSYFFISSFIEKHIEFHAKYLSDLD